MKHTHSLADCSARLRTWIESAPELRRAPSGPARVLLTQEQEVWPFEELACDLFAAQYESNAAYRQFCRARGVTPSTVSSWPEIPAMPAAAFKDQEMSCIPQGAQSAVFYSSGTTARGASRHAHHAASMAIYETSVRRWFATHLLGGDEKRQRSTRMFILTPRGTQTPHSSLVHMFETVAEAYGSQETMWVGETTPEGAWKLEGAAAVDGLERTAKTQEPLMLLGTAFSFVHLLDYLSDHRVRFELPRGSRVMETGGYKGRSRSVPKVELHRLMTDRLGVPSSHIVCEYGMSELSSQAYDRAIGREELECGKRVFRFAPWVKVQIVSPETGQEVAEGETGLVRILDLANVYSVMAVQTEDLGIRRGRGFELVGRAAVAEPRGCSLMALP